MFKFIIKISMRLICTIIATTPISAFADTGTTWHAVASDSFGQHAYVQGEGSEDLALVVAQSTCEKNSRYVCDASMAVPESLFLSLVVCTFHESAHQSFVGESRLNRVFAEADAVRQGKDAGYSECQMIPLRSQRENPSFATDMSAWIAMSYDTRGNLYTIEDHIGTYKTANEAAMIHCAFEKPVGASCLGSRAVPENHFLTAMICINDGLFEFIIGESSLNQNDSRSNAYQEAQDLGYRNGQCKPPETR